MSGARCQVLVVDDDALFCDAASLTLEAAGFEVHACCSVAQATAVLRERPVDVLLADLQIPGNAGLEWLGSLAAQHPRLRVVVCTGYPTLETAITAVGLPILAYLVKPVTSERLVQSVRDAHARVRSDRPPHTKTPLPERLETAGRRYGLSPRQVQVLELMIHGRSNKEIAQELGCAVRTVELHVSEVLRRSGTESRSSLIARLWSEPAVGQGRHEAG